MAQKRPPVRESRRCAVRRDPNRARADLPMPLLVPLPTRRQFAQSQSFHLRQPQTTV
jgi:hypothetical protein